jgi:hypothetical protein
MLRCCEALLDVVGFLVMVLVDTGGGVEVIWSVLELMSCCYRRIRELPAGRCEILNLRWRKQVGD